VSTAIHTDHLSENDLALFAMQLLSEIEMSAAARHIEICDVCLPRLAETQGDLAILALTSDLQTPPAEARTQFLQQVSKEKKFIPVADAQASTGHDPVLAQRSSKIFEVYSKDDRAPRRSGVATFLGWSGWAIAAAAGVFAFLQFQQREQLRQNLETQQASLAEATSQAAHAQDVLHTLTDAGAMRVSLHLAGTASKPQPEAHATYIASTGALVLVATHLDQVTSGKTYELWLLPSEKGLAPIPAGLFRPDAQGSATVVLPQLPKGSRQGLWRDHRSRSRGYDADSSHRPRRLLNQAQLQTVFPRRLPSL
jgi:anti-sigma-K factor RskA